MTLQVGLVIGSLRRASFSRRIAQTLPGLAPASLTFREIAIGTLPLYNEDLEADVPQAWATFRAAVRASDALLFVTPEYNRSMPGALKNAVDVGSKPYGQNCWNGKPAGIMGLSSGPLGGMAAAHNLRQALVTVNVASMAHPEVYLSHAAKLFDDAGAVVPATQDFLRGYLQAFEAWVERFHPARKS
jgi:chromate reductase